VTATAGDAGGACAVVSGLVEDVVVGRADSRVAVTGGQLAAGFSARMAQPAPNLVIHLEVHSDVSAAVASGALYAFGSGKVSVALLTAPSTNLPFFSGAAATRTVSLADVLFIDGASTAAGVSTPTTAEASNLLNVGIGTLFRESPWRFTNGSLPTLLPP
jgi:hypothetical protein